MNIVIVSGMELYGLYGIVNNSAGLKGRQDFRHACNE